MGGPGGGALACSTEIGADFSFRFSGNQLLYVIVSSRFDAE